MKKNNDFYESLMVKFGFLLHHKFSVHMLVLFILNLISSAAVIGIFKITKYPLVKYNIGSFIVYMLVVLFIEIVVKMFLLRYFITAIFRSWGLLTFGIQIIIFFITSLFVPDFEFLPDTLLNVVIFTLAFFLIRTILINMYQKHILKYLKKENKKNGSKNTRNN